MGVKKFEEFIKNYENDVAGMIQLDSSFSLDVMRHSSDSKIQKILDGLSDSELKIMWGNYKQLQTIHITSYQNPLTLWMGFTKEGLIHTYPIETSVNYMCNYFYLKRDLTIKVVNGFNGGERIMILASKAFDNIDEIKRAMNLCGYYVSRPNDKEFESFDDNYNWFQFEPKIYPDDSKKIRNEETKLFHLTPHYNIDKIKRLGFIPSCKNELYMYPDRTYFFRGSVDRDEIIEFANQLKKTISNKHTKDRRNPSKFYLISIDLDKVPENVRLCLDQNYINGVHTQDSIMPDVITDIEEIQI